jgi:UPF0755 protein
MKRKLIFGFFVLLLIPAGFFAWKFFGASVQPPTAKYFYIKTGSDYNTVKQQLLKEGILGSDVYFNFIANRMGYPKLVKAGRYEIKSGTSLYALVRMLRSGNQSPISLVINKWRTTDDLVAHLARLFEPDTTAFRGYITNADSLRVFNLDSNTVMTAIIPNTYSINWNSSPSKIFHKLYNEREKFWTPERRKKAAALNLDPIKVYTLASIVQEETNLETDMGKIASVYLNRMETGMKLGADPTVKFALKDFGLKRILHKHLTVVSPYNTYLNSGLPPGPICTPSPKAIDAVLNAPSTNYLYFVAQPNLTGYSNFASTYDEHLQYARQYQVWIDSFLRAKAAKQP